MLVNPSSGWRWAAGPGTGPTARVLSTNSCSAATAARTCAAAFLRARFTADVSAGWHMTKDFSALAQGFDRLMDMDTYNSRSLPQWSNTFDGFARGAPSAPLSAKSVGLGCWADNRSCTGCANITATMPWSVSAQSATDRICAVMNVSAPEVSFWVLAGLAPSPQEFWWPQLQRYRAGGGCAIPSGPPPAPTPLPAAH